MTSKKIDQLSAETRAAITAYSWHLINEQKFKESERDLLAASAKIPPSEIEDFARITAEIRKNSVKK